MSESGAGFVSKTARAQGSRMMTVKLLTVVWLSTTDVKVIEYEPWSLKVIPVILTYPLSPSALIVRDENAAAGVDASVEG